MAWYELLCTTWFRAGRTWSCVAVSVGVAQAFAKCVLWSEDNTRPQGGLRHRSLRLCSRFAGRASPTGSPAEFPKSGGGPRHMPGRSGHGRTWASSTAKSERLGSGCQDKAAPGSPRIPSRVSGGFQRGKSSSRRGLGLSVMLLATLFVRGPHHRNRLQTIRSARMRCLKAGTAGHVHCHVGAGNSGGAAALRASRARSAPHRGKSCHTRNQTCDARP